ncbi:MAG: hypothetical protein Q4B81_05205 [Moraxella sp.]|nr:hypothetical protein [Moraxella sp.]
MAREAYREKSRETKVSAFDITISDKDTFFYCPNKNCNAILKIRDIGGNPYFASEQHHKHTEKCPYRAGKSYHDYDEDKFNLGNMLDFLMNSAGSHHSYKKSDIDIDKTDNANKENSKGPIRTLKNFYYMCKDFSIDSTYNGYRIGKMLLDERSLKKYHSKGIFGKKVVECQSLSYDRNEQTITSKVGDYTIILKFQNLKLYTDTVTRIYNNAPPNKFSGLQILVAGDWARTDKFNYFATTIFSKKQIAINIMQE